MYDEKDNDLEVNEAQPDYTRLYTVEDYHTWDERFRAELYEGTLIVSEAPTRRHQDVFRELIVQLGTFLKGKPCKLYPAPFSVRLTKDEETIFEPDIVVICDGSKLNKRGCDGAPDFIIEILSPSTTRMDRKLKFDKYQKAGVKEYWIIDPDRCLLEANLLINNKYVTTVYNETENTPITTLNNFEINLTEVFAM